MREQNVAQRQNVQCTEEDLGNAIDEIVGLYLELDVAALAEQSTLRRRLAAAGFRLNRLAARQRAA